MVKFGWMELQRSKMVLCCKVYSLYAIALNLLRLIAKAYFMIVMSFEMFVKGSYQSLLTLVSCTMEYVIRALPTG